MERIKDTVVLTRHIEVEDEAESNPNPERQLDTPSDIADDDVLRAQGHKAVLKRSFSIVATLGLAFKYKITPIHDALI
jgi:choline transport protein